MARRGMRIMLTLTFLECSHRVNLTELPPVIEWNRHAPEDPDSPASGDSSTRYLATKAGRGDEKGAGGVRRRSF